MTQLSRPAPVDKEIYKQLQHYCIDNEIEPREALEAAIQEFIKTNGGKTNAK